MPPYLQVAMEESPRYEGAASTTPYRVSTTSLYLPVQEGGITPNPQGIDRSDEVRGIAGDVPDLLDVYQPEGGIRVRAYANALTWLLHLCGLEGTYTAGDGIITDPDAATIPVGAARWVFAKRTNRTAKTAQIIAGYVDDGVFLKGQGYGATSLGWGVNEGEFALDLMGLVCLPIANPSLTPSYDTQAIPHFRRADFQLATWLAGSGESDNFTLALANPLESRDSFSATARSAFPDRMFHADRWPTLTGTTPKYLLDPDDITALLAMSTFAAKAKWESDKVIGATAKKYTAWLEMPACQISGGDIDRVGNRRRHGASFNWKAAYDETAGYDFRFTIVNAVTSAAFQTLA